MKTITFAIAALMMTACSSSRYGHSSRNETTSRRLSGTSTAAVPAGNTMNDHDKMLEMCRSMRTTKSCDDIIKQCEGQSNPHSCVRSYMK